MPIHTSWKSMARSMLNNPKYCKKAPKRKCQDFSDGSRVCGCQGGWNIFFATVKSMGANEKKPRPKAKKKFQESKEKIVEWFVAEAKKYPVLPRWIGLANQILDSPQFNESVKTYWRDKLREFCKTHKDASVCQEVI